MDAFTELGLGSRLPQRTSLSVDRIGTTWNQAIDRSGRCLLRGRRSRVGCKEKTRSSEVYLRLPIQIPNNRHTKNRRTRLPGTYSRCCCKDPANRPEACPSGFYPIDLRSQRSMEISALATRVRPRIDQHRSETTKSAEKLSRNTTRDPASSGTPR